MSNPAIHHQPNGDVDIAVSEDQADALAQGDELAGPEPSVDDDNLDHPEELGGE